MDTPIDLSAAKPATVKALSQQIATRETDPLYFAALRALPNPDIILRKLGRTADVFDAIMADAHVIGEVRTIRGGVLSWDWRIQKGGEETRDIQAAELCEKIFSERPAPRLTWSDVIWNMARAMFYGYAIHETTWRREGNFIVPASTLDRPQRRFQFDNANELRLITKNNQVDGEELGPYKWLITGHMKSYDNPYGVALLSACFWPYTFKHSGYKWFAKFVEKYGIPKAIGKYPLGTNKQQIDELLDGLANMVEDAVGAIPVGNEIEIVQPTVGQHGSHTKLIDGCNREISKALTSQTLGTEVQEAGGARAVSETGRDREKAGQEADRGMIEDTMNQFCAWITELNYPGARPPTFNYYDEAQTNGQTVDALIKVISVAPVTKAEFYNRTGLTQPQEDDEVIEVTAVKSPENKPDDGSQFSACPSCGGTHTFVEGDGLLDIAAAGHVNAEQLIEGMVDTVKLELDKATDLAQFAATLPTLLPNLAPNELSEQITLVTLLARLEAQEQS